METKRKIRRSRSLSDILKVCIPNIEKKGNKDISKNQEKSKNATDCNGNEEKPVSLGIKYLYKKNESSTTTNVDKPATSHSNQGGDEASKVLLTASQNGGTRVPQKKKPSRKSYRRKRRATLADLTCIGILKPIPEMEEEEPEFNSAVGQANLTVRGQLSKDSEISHNDIKQQLGDVNHEGGSGQRQSWDEMMEDMHQWKHDLENLRYPTDVHTDMRSLKRPNGESFGQPIEPSNKNNDLNKDSNVEEQAAQDYSSEENDDDSESTHELKEALSNYEISYDVDEDENSNIFERLLDNYKVSRQRSDSLSSLSTKSVRSDGSMSSVSPVDEQLLHEKMQTVEVPRRRRRFSTSDLHLRCLLHALPSITEENKKNSFCSTASSDSNESMHTDLMRRRSGSLPHILAFREAVIMKQRNDAKPEGPQVKTDEEDDSSHKQQSKLKHREETLLGHPQLSPNATASKKFKRRNSMSVLEEVKLKNSTHPAPAQKGDVQDVPLSIEKNVSTLENGGKEDSSKKSPIDSKNLVKALGQKMRASIRRRNSIASLKPWTGIVERSLRSSFPLTTGEENEDGTENKMDEIPKKKNIAGDLKLRFSGDFKSQEKDNVSVVKTEASPDVLLHKDVTTSGIEHCVASGVVISKQSTNSAFTHPKKHYGADKENNLKTVEQILEDVKNCHKNGSLTGGEAGGKSPAKKSFMSKSEDQAEENPPHLTTKPQSKVSTFSRSRSSSVKDTPVSKPKEVVNLSSSKNATSVRPQSPKLENKRKVSIGRTSSNPLPRTSPNSNRPPSPSAFTRKNQGMKQDSLSPRSVKGTVDKERPAKTASNRPPSPSAVVNKKQGMKQDLSSSKGAKGRVDAKAPSNRPPSPSSISKTNQGIKHEISSSKSGKGTFGKASLNRPPSPSTITRKNQGMKQESSSSRSGKGTLPKETPPKTISNRPPSPSAFTKANQDTKQGFSSTISGKGTNESKSSGKTASKPSSKTMAQNPQRPPSPVTRKRNNNSPQVTRKAGSSSMLNEKKEVPSNVSNKPRKRSVIADKEEEPKDKSDRALEGVAADPEKVNTTVNVENVASENVPKKQDMNKEERPIEKVSKEEKDHESEKVKVAITEVSKSTINDNMDDKPRERKTSVNVIRRPLSASLVIAIPASPSTKNEDKENLSKQVRSSTFSKLNQEEISFTKAFSSDNSNTESSAASQSYQEPSNRQVKVDQKVDQGIEKELVSFGSLLDEFENTAHTTPEQKNYDNEASKTSNEATPTDKRFAALSERYNAIMSKFGMLNKTPSSGRTSAVQTTSAVSVTSPSENKVSLKLGVSLPVSEDIKKARGSLPLSEDRVNKVAPAGSSQFITENNGSKVGMTLPVAESKVETREVNLLESANAVINKENSSPVPVEKIEASLPVGASLSLSKKRENKDSTPLQVSEDNIGKEDLNSVFQRNSSVSNEVNMVETSISGDRVSKPEVSIPLSKDIVRKNGVNLPLSENKLDKGTTIISHNDNSLPPSPEGDQTKTSLNTLFSTENVKEISSAPIAMSELLTFGDHPTPSVLIKTDGPKIAPPFDTLYSHQNASNFSISKVDKEKGVIVKTEENGVENIDKDNPVKVEEKPTVSQRTVSHGEPNVQSPIRPAQEFLLLKASHNDEEKTALPTEHTTVSMTFEDTKDSIELCRTTVLARLMNRKLGPRRKTSIVPTHAVRKSRVFNDSEAGMKGIPFTMGHFNRYRDYIEKVTLKSTVRTEAMSIHDILNSLDTSLVEMELISLCKECTKTLRTLDALGSLPSYLSPNTVIVNPSGTIKFRHLNTDVTIDELFLAPEHTKKFSSEKTCVFSLAVTIWLAADWKLTEHKKPALSRKFQELLVSMTTDSSTERASLDSILQTCESLHTDNEMTSRERCQALLWECQATKDLDKQNVNKKAIEESEKTKAQHAILMGSVSVAANVKGFLKQTQSPAEGEIVQDTKPRDIINKSLEKVPQRKSSIEQEIDRNKGKQTNPKAPSPAGSMFSHYHNTADPSMMFSPISGNPNANNQSSFPGGQSQTSTPTFVPIAVPVPTAGPPPMWYMTPSGMVPFGPMGHHPGYFIPVNQGSGSPVVSDGEISGINEMAPKEIGRDSRSSTPMSETSQRSSASKTTRTVTPSTKSKIPRPIRDPNRGSPRSRNLQYPRDEPETFTTTRQTDSPQVRKSKKEEVIISPTTESSGSSLGNSSTTTSSYRSHTPPIRLRSGSVELEREGLRRPRPRSSSGSLVSTPPSEERTSRPSSPVTYGNRSERSRPSSPSFSEGRSGSRSSSPVGSRSSSPVAALISRFEDLTTKQQASEHSQSVSNLLSKFGSSSLLPEDRLTKRQFKTNTPQTKERDSYGRSGPFRPTSAADQYASELRSDRNEALSRSWPAKPTQRQHDHNDASSLNSDDSLSSSLGNSPPSRNRRNKETASNRETQSYGSSLSMQTRNRLASSLENLYGVSYGEKNRQSTEQYSMARNSERSWTSMENVHKASTEEQTMGYRIRKSSSAENLSKEYTDMDLTSKDHGISSIRSQGLRRSLEENQYSGHPYASDKDMGKDKMSLVKKLSLERTVPRDTDKSKSRYLIDNSGLSTTSDNNQELNISRRETARESILKSNVMKPERDYQQDYTKEVVSSSGRSRFEIPVAIAVMDNERERIGSSAFAPSLFSPSSSIKDKAFFQHPIKLEKESAPLSPPVPLSPSVKDCRPTSYFSSLSFTDLAMKPDKDTTLGRKRKDDTEHHHRATSYQVGTEGVGIIGHHDKQTKPDKIELIDKNSNIEKLVFTKDNSHKNDLDKGSSSRNSSFNSNDYLERFQKRLTKTNSLENIRQDIEGQIDLGHNDSKPKTFEENAPSTKPHLTIRESLGKLSAGSLRHSVEKVEPILHDKGTLSSLDSRGIRGSRSSQTETEGKRINERSPSDTGGKEKGASNDNQQKSRNESSATPTQQQSSQSGSNASSKPSSVTGNPGNPPTNPPANKPSSDPNTPTSGNSKYPKYFSYTRRKSSPHVVPSSEELRSKRLHDIHSEKSAKQDTSSSSKLEDRKPTKQSSKPNSPAPSRTQPSAAAEQNTFDFSEKALTEKGTGNVPIDKQLTRNMRHEKLAKTQSIPLSIEQILSKKTQDNDVRTDSPDLTSPKWGNVRQMVLRSPTSPTSSSNSSSSSPSPRLPLNKSMFYFPQSERVEKQFSPTEHLNTSGQKGFVITDTSRQSKSKSKTAERSDNVVSQKDPRSVTGTEKKESKTKSRNEEKGDFKNLSIKTGLKTEVHVGEANVMKAEEKDSIFNKVTKQVNKENRYIGFDMDKMTAVGRQSSTTAQPSKYDNKNMNLPNEDVKKQEQVMDKKLEKCSHRSRRYSENSEEPKQTPTSKESNVTSVGQGGVSGERRRSIDLRQIYNSARRASLTPRTDTASPRLSPSTSTTSRPNSALDKRPPSPGRLDSKELLGHFVKKMLNSATAAKPSGGSPSSSFAEGTSQQSREPLKTDILGKYVSSPRERTNSSENKHKDRKESLERMQEGAVERRERKVSHERKQQHIDQERHEKTRERKVSHERVPQHDSQGRIDGRRERKVSHERRHQHDSKERKTSHEKEQQHGDQGRVDATRERKVSHERRHQHDSKEKKSSHEKEQQHGDQGRIDATRERKTSHERRQKHEEQQARIDPKTDRMISNEREHQKEGVKAPEKRLSHEKDKQPLSHKAAENPILKLNEDLLQTQQESLDTSGDNDVLGKLVDMIHDEFAFDGYLDDGVEDVNMGEYVMSLSGMSEDMFKESVRDQYSDLYWDDDLLQDMYILVNRKLTSRRPTLRFSESTASDLSRPGSSLSMDSSSDTTHLVTRSVSRTSSERSFLETRDYVMSSLGEPTQFLPFKMICPEIIRDIIEELGPVFEDYQKEMRIKLAPSISELMEKLGAKILEIGQQLTLERRAKKKNIASFKKVADIDHKKDVKDLASKLLQEIEESDKKIIYLKYIQRRLRNIYAERFGLDHSLLYSFVSSYSITNVSLEAKRQNNLLSFSPLWDQRSNQSSEAHGESTRGPVLQYGTTQGLYSYLFARHSMSQAFVRFFLYTFRYCATPDELFDFIRDKCRASLRAETGSDKTYNHQLQIRYRALDLLAEWTDCCFQFDFKTNPGLLESLFAFLDEELIPVDKTERGKMLVELITEKQRKDEEEHIEETTDTLAVLQTDDNQGLILEKESPKKFPIKRKKSPAVQCFKRGSPQASSMYKPTVYLKAMSVIDHSSRTIAEQLTLIQQDVFARVHSIHFLNSRTLGIGVGRLSPTKETTQLDSMLGFSAGRRRSITSDTLNTDIPSPRTSGESNLFVCQPVTDGCLENLLMHAQDVSMWVAVEICTAPSVKNQLVLIQKYISVAKYCAEMRNFATSVQVVDALEMFVIRQLPVWKQVPNKVIQTLEELKAIKVLLKTDSSWLLKDNAYREKPTIPCALLFLMHIQQLELGGFTLANGMYKWTKMRSIARLVDQIRLFKQMRYAFESNETLKDRLRMRIQECREENLHALAAENAANFHLSSSQSSRKFQEAFKKMKATFGKE